MRIARTALVLVLALASTAGPVRAGHEDPAGLARAIARKLNARKATITPKTHTTDFGSDLLGCITLARWELADFGYRGHAFFCEESVDGEILGAVLNRSGVVRCDIVGYHIGDGCYDFDICDYEETACVE